ncbi:MAG: hypothetical protein QM760_20485 [Nibricoccus sp.]
MITTKQLIGAAALGLATIVTSSSAIAQADADSASPGLIGKRYAGADFLLKDYRDLADNGYGGTLVFNQPISEVVDLSANYAFNQANSQSTDLTQSAISVGAVYYQQLDGYKPFMSAGLGYVWDHWDFPAPTVGDNDEGFSYKIGLGVEVPLTDKTAAIGEVSYQDGIDSGTEESWGIELGVNHWFTEKVALKASVYVVEDDSVSFRIGARFAF